MGNEEVQLFRHFRKTYSGMQPATSCNVMCISNTSCCTLAYCFLVGSVTLSWHCNERNTNFYRLPANPFWFFLV